MRPSRHLQIACVFLGIAAGARLLALLLQPDSDFVTTYAAAQWEPPVATYTATNDSPWWCWISATSRAGQVTIAPQGHWVATGNPQAFVVTPAVPVDVPGTYHDSIDFASEPLYGDCDRSGIVDVLDVAGMILRFGGLAPDGWDVDGDGLIGIFEVIETVANFGRSVEP